MHAHRQTDTAQMYTDKRNEASGLVTNINVCLPFYTQVTSNDHHVYIFKGILKQQNLQQALQPVFISYQACLACTYLLLCKIYVI